MLSLSNRAIPLSQPVNVNGFFSKNLLDAVFASSIFNKKCECNDES